MFGKALLQLIVEMACRSKLGGAAQAGPAFMIQQLDQWEFQIQH